ncbi:MAG: lysophospholipid acyltransferase family protein, partial [Myxococcota bacterium]
VFGAVLVDRRPAADGVTRVEAARRTVEATAAAIGTNRSLILFPEGTRGNGDDVAPFKSGLYHLCRLRPELEIVPAWLENLNRVLPKGEVLPIPLLGSVTFGAPMRLAPDESKDGFLARARDALQKVRPT